MALAALQLLWMDWLRSQAAPPAALLAEIRPQAGSAEGLEVYRRTSRHAQQAALAAVYPVLTTLIGEALFRALCRDHLLAHGSRSGDLHRLGADFWRCIQAEPACRPYPFLVDVCRLEWCVHRSFFSADRSPLAGVDPATVAAHDFPRLRLLLHPGLQLLACATPAAEIWRAHQPEAGVEQDKNALAASPRADGGKSSPAQAGTEASPQDAGSLDLLGRITALDTPEWLAIFRQPAGVCIHALSPAEHALLASSLTGASLEQALEDSAGVLQHPQAWLARSVNHPADPGPAALDSAAAELAALDPAGMDPAAMDLARCVPAWLQAGLLLGFALRD